MDLHKSKTILLSSILLAYLSLNACNEQQTPPPDTSTSSPSPITEVEISPTPTQTQTTPKQRNVKVFLPKQPQSNQDFSYVEPVVRSTTSRAVATFAIEQLIMGPTKAETKIGFTEALQLKGSSNCGKDFTLSIAAETATLKFCRAIPSPGVGYDARATSAIESTLKQFSTIKSVVILNKDGNCFGDLSGENLCLKTGSKGERLSTKSKIAINGIGPITVGMTLEEASQAGKVKLLPEDASSRRDYGCLISQPEGIENLWFMAIEGKIARVDTRSPQISTISGIKVGDKLEKVMSVYGNKIELEPHQYVPGGKYATFVPTDSSDKNYRLIFETNPEGKVTTFRAGKLPEVAWVEGCF
ncbi:GerMN domain-containing protein [Moorena producens JHB]|uniref:GerMN domain-containing protein n=1 Tax=Moorena producens (strain JHB) TaxID=1454205 RepID=A0A9Q9SUG2_MOOP1|nr:GerMN domain-containing protein [Moorena producens]WAN69853.1 GerMN domain-containing protein [Moorena producens JHB]